MFLGPQYGTSLVSPFWRQEFFSWFLDFFNTLCTPELHSYSGGQVNVVLAHWLICVRALDRNYFVRSFRRATRRVLEGRFCAPGRMLDAANFISIDTSLDWYEL